MYSKYISKYSNINIKIKAEILKLHKKRKISKHLITDIIKAQCYIRFYFLSKQLFY